MTVQYDAQGNLIPQGQQQQPQGHNMQPAYQQQGYQQSNMPAQISPDQVPAHLRQEAPTENEMDAGAGLGGPRLSIKGKQFRFIEGDVERAHPFGQPLNVIIVKTDPTPGVAKNFYTGAYVEGEDQSPVCYSSDGITPDSGSEQVQCETCGLCPHNKFGTAKHQDGTMGKGKACRDFKRVYVVPDNNPHSEPYEMRVPATSFKNMQTFGNQCKKAGVRTYAVVCTLNFAAETSPVLTFTFASFVDQNTYDVIQQRLASGEIDAILPSHNKTPAAAPAGAVPGQQALPSGVPADGQPAGTQSQPAQQTTGAAMPPPPPGSQGNAAPPPAQPAPCPLGAPAGFKMTESAGGVTYQAYIQAGWTDKNLIDTGHMVQVI